MANLCTTVTGYVAKHFFFPSVHGGLFLEEMSI